MPSEARVALITGCGKPVGIGNSTARALAAAGVTVVVSDVSPAGVANEHNVQGDMYFWSGAKAKELLDLLKRLADDAINTWRAMPKSQAMRWYGAILRHAPTILREGQLSSAARLSVREPWLPPVINTVTTPAGGFGAIAKNSSRTGRPVTSARPFGK